MMRGQLKPVLPGNLDLLLFDDGVVELGNSVAVDTDEMVVMIFRIENFKHRLPIDKTALLDQACIFKQIERAVDSSDAGT